MTQLVSNQKHAGAKPKLDQRPPKVEKITATGNRLLKTEKSVSTIDMILPNAMFKTCLEVESINLTKRFLVSAE